MKNAGGGGIIFIFIFIYIKKKYYIYIYGGFCDLAISALKKMAIKKFKNSWATKRKADWLKAQWVNETCRDLQAKVIKTAAFCHNRAFRDLYREIERERE